MIVTLPLSSTSTSLASGFTFLTSSLTFAFSSSVNLSLFSTSVLFGATAGFFSASVFAFSVTVCSGVKVFVDLSGYVNVTDPSFPTSTFSAFGFLSLTFFSTSAFSSGVRAVLSLTSVFSGATAGFFCASVLSTTLTTT